MPKLKPVSIKTIGLVAYGKDHEADVSVANLNSTDDWVIFGGREDSNFHPVKEQHLNAARLIPPRPHTVFHVFSLCY